MARDSALTQGLKRAHVSLRFELNETRHAVAGKWLRGICNNMPRAINTVTTALCAILITAPNSLVCRAIPLGAEVPVGELHPLLRFAV